MIDELKDQLDLWFRAHLQGIRSTVIVFGVVLLCAVSSYFVTWRMQPRVSIPAAPPTVTATFDPPTHIPSRTLSPTGTKLPATETETKEATWTHEITRRTATNTTTPTRTGAALTPTLTRIVTTTPLPPTRTPAITIPAGRNVLTLTPHPLPRTGASQQELADMTATAPPRANTPNTGTASATPTANRITLPEGCVYHSLYLEPGLGYDVLTFHCPTILDRVTPGAVGGTD